MKRFIILLLLLQLPLFSAHLTVILQDINPPGQENFRVLNHYFKKIDFLKVTPKKPLKALLKQARETKSDLTIHARIDQGDLLFDCYHKDHQTPYLHHRERFKESAFPRGIIRVFAFFKLEQLETLDLFEAISRNDQKMVDYFIKKGDFDRPNSSGKSPLLHALQEQKDQFIQPLLAAGASPYRVDQSNLMPLHYLASLKNDLFEKHYSPLLKGVQTKTGHTLLHFAARSGDLNRVKSLIAAGLSPDIRTDSGEHLLHFAAESGDLPFFKEMIQFSKIDLKQLPKLTTKRGKSIIHSAACGGSQELIQWLTGQQVAITTVDHRKRTLRYYAIRCGQNKLLPYLKQQGLKESPRDLLTAIQYQNIDLIKQLNPSPDQWLKPAPISPLLPAFQHLPLPYIKTVLATLPDRWKTVQSPDGLTPIHYTILGRKFDTFLYLQQQGITLNQKTKFGANSLYFSMLTQQKRFFLYLIARGVSVKTVFENGENLLHQAAKIEHLWFFHYLKKRFPEMVYSSPKLKESFLHIAIKNGNIPLLKQLLKGEYKINLFDIHGNTPLNFTILSGNRKMFDLILKEKPFLHIPNREGLCPLDIALLKKEHYMSERLREELAPQCMK